MKNIPVLIINDGILFPGNEYRMETKDPKLQEILNIVDQQPDRQLIVIHSLDNESTDDVLQFPSLGVLAHLDLKLVIPNSKMRSVIVGLERVRITHYEKVDGYFYGEIEEIVNHNDMAMERIYLDTVFRTYEEYVKELTSISNAMIHELASVQDLGTLVDIIAFMLPLTKEQKKDYLYEIDPIERATKLLEQLKEEIEIAKLEKNIEAKVHHQLDEEQKKYYLREKMKVIAEEIGDSQSKNYELQQYQTKLQKLKAPSRIKKRIKEELKRYEGVSQNAPEITMIRDYLDWMLQLPWDHKTKDVTSLKEIEEILEANHYGMKDVKTRILEYIAVKQNAKQDNSPILCLIGPPGVGKTSLAYSIAKSLHRNLATISVGGINDEAEIVGHRRTYIGALPGRIIQGIKKAGSSNPVFVIDEIDKMTKSMKGDPASSLLEVLDKEQNNHFSDHYIEESYDLSQVMFIATANYEEQIPPELKDRLEIIYIPSYTEYEKVEIATNYLIPKVLQEHGLTAFQVQFSKEALLHIIRYYTKEAGVRDLQRAIAKVCRKIVKKNLEEKQDHFYQIEVADIATYLGKKIYTAHDTKEEKVVGVVNGLAYTPFGGDTLPIETTYYEGKGNLYLTGSLGEVMQESAQIALSYIKANYKRFGLRKEVLNQDIHIHVPEGAVSKEGPSAGVALTTSLISALGKKKVSTKVAMTGEITLQGNVLAIGGVREKVLGAKRAGITTIYLPKDNEVDVEELPKDLIKNMTFHFVSTYQEIAEQLFLSEELVTM